jgi:hypothetical protein
MVMGKNAWTALAVMVVLGVGLLVAVKTGCAADDDKKEKEARDTVVKIAADLEGNKQDDAVKKARDLAKMLEDVEFAMNVMKPREDGGLGFGAKPGKDPKEDGIEPKVQALAKDPLSKEELAAQAPDIVKMAYTIAAVSHVAQAKGMPEDAKKGKPADWKKWSESMSKDALELAELAKAKRTTPAQLHAAAKKLDGTCTKCHDTFK